MIIDHIKCELCEEHFKNNTDNTPSFANGDVSVRWLTNANINTANREYQREKVATDAWKQDIMETILDRTHAGIPEIHIRVMYAHHGEVLRYELIDGQQRVTSFLEFLDPTSGLRLPDSLTSVDGCDVSGMTVTELRNTYERIYEKILEYRISCKWYQNISDTLVHEMFVQILNNTNDMKPQEIRNAISGPYSTYIRDRSRIGGSSIEPHELFARLRVTKGSTEKEYLQFFSRKFPLKGRMEMDEWLSEIAYLRLNGVRKGINHPKHRKWVEDTQAPGGEYLHVFTDQKEIEKLLTLALTLMKSVPKGYKNKLNPMTSMMLVLYAADLIERYGKITSSTYVKKFFKVYDAWSNTTTKLYANEQMINGNQMTPFKELFGGKNANAIGTIFKVLDFELDQQGGLDSFGVVELDPRPRFSQEDIVRKWQKQNEKCFYTGNDLDIDDLAGDHYIPRSHGVARGGVTEYHNLVVTSVALNMKKGNRHGDDFMTEQRDVAEQRRKSA
jgi:hypothetical protein